MKPSAREIFGSEYMQWAKTSSHARFNLATSGLANVRLEELQVGLSDIELTRDGGYGYEPLQQALAGHLNVDAESVIVPCNRNIAGQSSCDGPIVRPGDEVLFEQPTY